jgi:hypothetical protein
LVDNGCFRLGRTSNGSDLKQESNEILAIAAKTRATAIQNQKKLKNGKPQK